MKIYHGSIALVTEPVIRHSNHTLDYGAGFYATTSHEQAERWVRRKMRENNVSIGYINVYEFDPQAMAQFKSLSFPTPTEEWQTGTYCRTTHLYSCGSIPFSHTEIFTSGTFH